KPPSNSTLIGRNVQLAEQGESLDPIKVDVELPRGVTVAGRVFDKTTGKGVPSSVIFMPLPENTLYEKFKDSLQLSARTDKDGGFRFNTISGPGVLLAQAIPTRELLKGVSTGSYPINRFKIAEFDPNDLELVKTSKEGNQTSLMVAGGGFTPMR